MVGGIKGTYTTTRDGVVVYTSEADCSMQGEDWHWDAVVRRGDQLRGHPSGVIYKARSFVEEPVLKIMVESAIEHRVGVE